MTLIYRKDKSENNGQLDARRWLCDWFRISQDNLEDVICDNSIVQNHKDGQNIIFKLGKDYFLLQFLVISESVSVLDGLEVVSFMEDVRNAFLDDNDL